MLELLENEEKIFAPKTSGQIRKELSDIWFQLYLEEFKEKYKEPFVKCMGILRQNFEAEEEGELLIGYPGLDEWTREIKKFFYQSPENWFRKNNKCTFFLFCKHYGRFDHHIKEIRNFSDPILSYGCRKCGVIMEHKRSHWIKYKNQHGRCGSCNERFPINDVLNQIPTISNALKSLGVK
jgi:hypothetical protein